MPIRSKSALQLTLEKNSFKPSPGTYNHKNTFDERKRSVVMGTSIRKDLTETERTPAPNYYDSVKASDYIDKSNPHYSMAHDTLRKSIDVKLDINSPGPS